MANDINSIIKQYSGKDVIEMPALTDIWEQWYEGDVKNFHEYEIYNGVKKVENCKRKTLNMAKKVAEDWANLLLNEKTNIVVGSENQQQALNDLLSSVYFWQKGNEGVEKTFALGNGAFVESVDDNKKIHLQFVNAKKVKPLTIEGDRITECAFVNTNTHTTIIQIHERGIYDDENKKFIINPEKTYKVQTLIFEKKNKNENIGELKSHTIVDTKNNKAWFQMYKPNIANNVDINSPLGISIYANAIDSLQGVDLAFDGFCEEMRLGVARIFINKELTHYDESGEHLVFDVNEKGFYYLGADGDKQPVTFYNPALRTDGYFNGINNSLNLLSSKCGLGANHYRFEENGINTATQVISEQSEKFKSKRKHEIILYDVLIDMSRALMQISNDFTNNNTKFDLNANIEVKFDDSIIEDKATEMLNARQDVASGLMSKVEYRMKFYGEDENTAKEKIKSINEERQSYTTNFFEE